MFVRYSKYRKVVAEAATLADQLAEQTRFKLAYRQQAEKLVRIAEEQQRRIDNDTMVINSLRAQVARKKSDFNPPLPGTVNITQDQLRLIIALCHPDKHGGKESANTLTQQLLKLRS